MKSLFLGSIVVVFCSALAQAMSPPVNTGSHSFDLRDMPAQPVLQSAAKTMSAKGPLPASANLNAGQKDDVTILGTGNDSYSALPILSGELYTNLFCDGDDWYSITLPTNGTIDVWMYFSPGYGQYDLDLYLLDSGMNQVGASTTGASNEHIYLDHCAGGTYYLDVNAWDDQSSNSYTLLATTGAMAITGLPQVLTVEMPADGMTTIRTAAAPLSNLLASATAGSYPVTYTPTNDFSLGRNWVTWTAWAGTPDASAVMSRQSQEVFVFPHGQTVLAVTENDYATAGNHGTSMTRDPAGNIHVAWYQQVDDVYTVLYQRGTQDRVTGAITWTTPVDVANGGAQWGSYVKLAATSNAVHFTWANGSGTANYRRLVNNSGTWTFDPIQVLTGVHGWHRDNGADIAAFNDNEVHIVTPAFDYAYTTNAADSHAWVIENMPWPPGMQQYKYPAVAVDSRGDVHVVFTAVIRTPNGVTSFNNYWQVWYEHRKRPGSATNWVESFDTNAQWPEWQDPGPGTNGVSNDALGDWMDIACDNDDTIYIGGHGVAISSRQCSRDDAFILRRTAAHDGDPFGFERPQRLHHHEDDTTNGLQYSWTPSFCCANTNGIVLPVIMYKALGAVNVFNPDDSFEYYNDMDSIARVLQDGQFIDGGAPVSLSQVALAGTKIGTWWPDAARKVYWDANGRAWLDVLQSMDASWLYRDGYVAGNADYTGIKTFVVFQQKEVTGFMPPTVIAQPADVIVGVGQTTTFSVAATGPTNGAPLAYQWTRNGVAIPGATNTSYTTDAAAAADDGSAFAVIVTALSHTTSRAAQLKVLTLARAWSWGDSNTAWVLFSAPVQTGAGSGGAENIANYSMNFGISITGAVLQADGRTVQLQTSGLVSGLDYCLIVNHVCAAAPENPIAANSMTSFRYLPANVTAWVDDAVPDGATTFADGGDAWTWVAANPAPFSGALAHQSNMASGESEHAFVDATQTLAVATNDTLFTYVYLDPANPPQEIMLAFYDGASWEHRAYWGWSLMATGVEGTASCTNIGALPVAGQWTRLEIPAGALGLNGATLTGMSFMQYGGRVTWDFSGTCSGTFHPVVDTTGCGIPDNWLVYYFGSTNASNSGPNDDWDHDGVSNFQEYLAGTNPTNAASRLDLTGCCKAGTGVTLSWQSVAGKSYGIQYSTNLASGETGWMDIASNLAATPPVNTCPCPTHPPGACFYRILLEP